MQKEEIIRLVKEMLDKRIKEVPDIITNLANTWVSLERVEEFMNEPEVVREEAEPRERGEQFWDVGFWDGVAQCGEEGCVVGGDVLSTESEASAREVRPLFQREFTVRLEEADHLERVHERREARIPVPSSATTAGHNLTYTPSSPTD